MGQLKELPEGYWERQERFKIALNKIKETNNKIKDKENKYVTTHAR